jgi:ABC-type Fe3+-hydroxamate transport system substrate-binding protein
MTKRYKIFAAFVMAIAIMLISFLLSGCSTEAAKVNANISKQADYFQSERRITVYNARTDTIILECEGYMSISNNDSSELVVTVKTGVNTYKKNYIYLNDYTLYVVEDITGTHTDPYHYKLYFNTNILPDVEVK